LTRLLPGIGTAIDSNTEIFLKTSNPQVRKILEGLKKEYPDVTCALHHENPLQLLIATILSAQCTDARVNMVTPSLFQKYPTVGDFAAASPSDLEELIRSTGFFRTKTKSILAACQRILKEFGGKVPQSMEELLALPGVARKTANVVLGTAYGIASGVVVDTHVLRLSHRLGLTREKTPEKVERDLMKKIPKNEWINFSHRLIHHGRRICIARHPACERCVLEKVCPKIGVNNQA
jgi:endonuclease III